jgi:hypothetical protein
MGKGLLLRYPDIEGVVSSVHSTSAQAEVAQRQSALQRREVMGSSPILTLQAPWELRTTFREVIMSGPVGGASNDDEDLVTSCGD